MITDNIVMWETRLSVVDGVSANIQISLETLKIVNQLRGEINVSSEVEHWSSLDLQEVIGVLHSLRNTESPAQEAAGKRMRNSNTKIF